MAHTIWSSLSERQRLAAVCLATAGLVGLATQSPDLARGAVGALGLLVFVVIALSGRSLAVTLAIVWLVLLGFVRRAMIPFAGWSENDPLLLVGPATAVVLLVAMRREEAPPRTLLTSAVMFQLLTILINILNPHEPSLAVAAQAAALMAIPFLWVFVGRKLSGADHDRILDTFMWMLVPVLALGYYHTFVGPLSFELTWIGVSGIPPGLIFVNGFNIRPFSTLVSPQEYGLFLSLGALVVWARILYATERRGRLMAFFGLTVVAMFLQGSRGVFASFLIAFVILGLVRARSGAAAFTAVALIATFSILVSQGLDLEPPKEDGPADSTASAVVQHQLRGLLNPTSSTLPLHLELWMGGFAQGLENPLGYGPSRFSIASQKAATATGEVSPENELSIAAASFGILGVGGLITLYLSAFVVLVRLNRWDPSGKHLAWLGMLIVVGDQALNSRLYATSTLVALMFGGAAREYATLRSTSRRSVPISSSSAGAGPELVAASGSHG